LLTFSLIDRPIPKVRALGKMCEEKLRLTQEYQAANQAFGHAVKVLAKNSGTTSKEEYERLRQKSEELRINSESARLRLERHIGQHGC
jgi:hypothetical protein